MPRFRIDTSNTGISELPCAPPTPPVPLPRSLKLCRRPRLAGRPWAGDGQGLGRRWPGLRRPSWELILAIAFTLECTGKFTLLNDGCRENILITSTRQVERDESRRQPAAATRQSGVLGLRPGTRHRLAHN